MEMSSVDPEIRDSLSLATLENPTCPIVAPVGCRSQPRGARWPETQDEKFESRMGVDPGAGGNQAVKGAFDKDKAQTTIHFTITSKYGNFSALKSRWTTANKDFRHHLEYHI